MRTAFLVPCLLLALSAAAAAAPEGWLDSLEDGLKEAPLGGQAILYVTKWKPGL